MATEEDYINRSIELGDDVVNYFTTEHRISGSIFSAVNACEKVGAHAKYGVEGYISRNWNQLVKEAFHIVMIPFTNQARRKLNKVTSDAEINGFYYRPRINPEYLISHVDPSEVAITTACVSGFLDDDELFHMLREHFGKNLLIEIQPHSDPEQVKHNLRCVQVAREYGLSLIAANDSHYVYPKQKHDRDSLLSVKWESYTADDGYLLDYPSWDEMVERFVLQGVVNKKEAEGALEQTLWFDECEDIEVNKDIKMPTLYPDLSPEEKVYKLTALCQERLDSRGWTGEDYEIRKAGMEYELQTVWDTRELNTADYFLFNEKGVDLAINKYGGVLTRSSRGSAGSFFLNNLLGITQIDRFNVKIPLYPERFMSTARLLESRALPDIDFNVAEQEPFAQAFRELLGEHGVYPMVAYGTMQTSEAFRVTCRIHGIPHEDYNEVAKNLDKYKDDRKWGRLYEESQTFLDCFVSVSPHPCAFLLLSGDIREELGVVRIKDKICCPITSLEADEYKYLKDDFLFVDVVRLISSVFKEIGEDILPLNELLERIDDKCWALYEQGLTATLNQTGTDYAMNLMKRYKARSLEEMQMFVAAVRPSFDAWREGFLNREPYSLGVPELDDLLSATNSYFLFQETLMLFLEWLDVTPAESITLIKKISKKKIKQEDFDALEERLREVWNRKTNGNDKFDQVWEEVQGCMGYGFAAPHAYATAVDSLYGAYLKANYPLEYYAVALNLFSKNERITVDLISELSYFGIKIASPKFGFPAKQYSYDRETKTIMKSISSVKYISETVSDIMDEIAKEKPETFTDILYATKKTDVDIRHVDILIKIGFFSQFGTMKQLLLIKDMWEALGKGGAKQPSKERIYSLGLEDLMDGISTQTEKQYRISDCHELIVRYENRVKERCLTEVPLKSQIQWSMEYCGTLTPTMRQEDRPKLYIDKMKPLRRKADKKLFAYAVHTISIGSGVEKDMFIFKNVYDKEPVEEKDVIYLQRWNKGEKNNFEWTIAKYEKIFQ